MTNILKTAIFLGLTFVNSFSQNITLSVDSNSATEGETITMTATLDAAIDSDVKVPLTITGGATADLDYTTSFASLGEETAVWQTNPSNYDNINVLEDGRQVVLTGSNLLVYNPDDDSTVTVNLPIYSNYLHINGSDVYASTSGSIYKLDLSDFSSVTYTEVLALSNDQSFNYKPSFEGDNILYNIYDSSISSNNRKTFKKEGDNDPVMIYQGNDCCYAPVLFNDISYQVENSSLYKIIDNEFVYVNSLGNINIDGNRIKVFQGNVYASVYDYNDGSDFNVIKKLNFEEGSSDLLAYVVDEAYASFSKFAFNDNGNLLVYTYKQQNTSEYTIFEYQLDPQLKVLAGETSGTITFTTVDDVTDEIDETIIVTPGTPTNATLNDDSAITLNIEDNDDAAVVTFAFSAATLVETNETTGVTLTATATPISAQEITIPLTLSGSASAGEYTVSAESITIPAGSATGSVTILGVDDTDVEVMETIVFTIGILVNGSTEETDITLNLESEDDPEISSIAASPETFEEGLSSTITMTISEASSRDVTIPVTIAGSATADLDFTTSFASLGEEDLVISTGTSGGQYSNFQILEDGRYVFRRYSSQLKVIDPEIGTTYTVSLANSASSIKTVGNTIYSQNSNNISAITIDSAGNITSEETLATPNINQYFSGDWAASGTTVYFQTYHNITGTQRIYSKQGANDAILLAVGNQYQYLFYHSDKLLAYNNNRVYEYKFSLGEFVEIGYVNDYLYDIKSINNKLYVKRILGEIYSISQMNVNSDNVTFGSPLQNVYGDQINQMQDYSVDSSGNLLLYNQETEGEYGVYKYQQDPQLKVLAGETSGTITFTTVDDVTDEIDETIIVTPGTPTNATLNDDSAITLNIEDNDDAAVVTFAFSAATLVETNETTGVTLTATATPISAQEITIPLTLSGSASAGEYTVSAESITIPAGSATGSVTILGVDDTDVEVMETIVFTIGILVNGSTEETDITLNLESEDDPEISSIAASPETFEEGLSSTITMTISEASSRDVTIPVTITGTATADSDYTTSFASLGEETLIKNIANNYNYFDIIEDGRYVFLSGNQLLVYNPSTDQSEQITLDYSYQFLQTSGNTIYSQTGYYNGSTASNEYVINSIDLSDLNNIVETQEVLLAPNTNFEQEFSVESGNILYNTYDSNNSVYQLFKKEGDATPELIHTFTSGNTNYLWGLSPVLVNDRVYLIQTYNSVYELSNGALVQQPQLLNEGEYIDLDNNFINVFDGKVYAKGLANNSAEGYQVYEVDFETGNTTKLNYTLGSQITTVKDFSLSATANLVLLNSNSDQSYGAYSYQLLPEIKVYAGDTVGTINFTIIDDQSDEIDETIIVTPGAPSNATLSTSSDIIATIEDNDEGPAITFSLSPASIVEGSTIPALLTATPSIVSGQEITLNYSLSGTADDPITFGSEAAEYLISSETLVIPANAASASIEIVSGLDDTAVEPIETIIFEFEQPENATFESGAFVTINLESDDDPVSALTATSSEVEEGGSTQLTITIDEPSSYELLVPLELTGDAMFNIDYTTNFDTEGRESVIMTPKSGQDYNSFEALEDGRLIFLNGNRIYLFDSELGSDPVQYYMYDAANNNNNMYFDYLQVSGNTIYLQDDGVIAKIEASELTDATNTSVYPTTLLTNSNANTYFSGSFFVEGEKILYQTNENWSEYKVYLKDGESDPVELYSGNQYANMLFLFNDRVYRADGQTIYELYNESYDNSISYSNANSFVLMKSYNGIAYFLIQNNNNEREIHRLDIESDIINGLNGNIGSSTLVNYQLGEEVNYVKNFTFDSAGNILLYNRVDPNNYWGVYNYQLSPQITIPAGEVSGTFTFAATDDEFYEPTEDIIITPGTPANGTLTNTTPLTIGILDNDTPPEVSFEFSNENIYEGSEVSVTLTATVDLQSGYEITIPFNMGGEANYNGAPDPSITDEYTLSAQSIVIPPNSTTGSIEISTYLNDDDLVETIESIIFVFGEIVVADAVVTNDTPTMTLNLISEDFPTIDSVPVVSETSVTEGESTSITININSAGSEDIYVPISMSGTAELNVDYAVETSAEGEESLLVDVTNNYNLYNQMGVLDDGRIVGLSGSQLTINDPAVATFNTAQLTQSYSYLTVDNNTIYVSTGTQLVQVDLTDISANIVAEEVVLTTPSNEYFEYSPSISNNTFVFNTYSNQSGNRSTYRKAGDADMQLIYTGTDCCYAPILFNDKIYQFDYWRVYELVDGELINQVNFNYGVDRNKIGVYNGEIIAMTDSNNGWQPHKIDPVTGAQTIFGGFSLGEDVVSIQQFTVKSDGNLILLNTLSTLQTNGSQETSWGIYSYNFNPVIKIEAGSTSGSLTINTINDSSFEPSETINAVVQTPTNAFINENSELEITILDNDDAPEITYALSSETITENSDVDVTLTATLSEITPFEITIPFELYAEGNSSTAEQDEFVIVDGATSIVIPANSESASISVSTDEIDDEVVEIMETIVFTFGDAQIGTEITDPAANESITLFLDSDDDPVVTSITVSPSEFGEHEFTNVEATISEPASRDVSINFGLTGTATQDLDYSFNFDGQGAESLVVTANGSYNYFDVLDDGRVVFLNSNQLIVVDPVTSESITVQLQHGYNDLEINDGNVYLKDSWRMGKLNVSNLDSAGSVSETTLFETPTNHQMEGTWDAEGNTVIFATWNTATNIRTIYKVIDENEPEVLYENPDGFDKLFYFNDLVYHINGNNLYILNEEGVFVQESYIVQNGCGGYVQSVDVYNGKVYVMYYDYCTNMNKVYHLSLTPVPGI